MKDPGGAATPSRTQLVLDPAFIEGLEELSIEELRRRRDEALAEREFQSYLRRLVQARQDILEAERIARRAGAEPQPLVERLRAVLSEGPQGRGRGEAVRVALSQEDMDQAERRAGAIAGSAAFDSPGAMHDEQLEEALAALALEQRRISDDRAAVLKVHDRLQDELKRRYREDPSLIGRKV